MSSAAPPELSPHARLRPWSISLVAALGVGSGLVLSGGVNPLPALPFAAAFLCAATQQDMRYRRIPNQLTFPGLLAALILTASAGGFAGIAQGALGLAVAFLLLFLPYTARGLGAGDVKAAMVLGALWGPQVVVAVLVWTAAISGTIAAGLLLHNATRPRAGTDETQPLKQGVPLAPAIGLGVIAYQLWGPPGPL